MHMSLKNKKLTGNSDLMLAMTRCFFISKRILTAVTSIPYMGEGRGKLLLIEEHNKLSYIHTYQVLACTAT